MKFESKQKKKIHSWKCVWSRRLQNGAILSRGDELINDSLVVHIIIS